MPAIVEWNLPREFLHEIRALGPRAYKAHVPLQNIPELRHLVQARLAQPPSERRVARIIDLRPDRPGLRLRVFVHRAKFVHREELSVLADAPLTVNGRSRRSQTNRQRDDNPD